MLRKASITAAVVGIIALLISTFTTPDTRFLYQSVQGKNNTILILANEHPGLCNVHLATLYSLVKNHPHLKIHYASFAKAAPRVRYVVELASQLQPAAQDVSFHTLNGTDFVVSLLKSVAAEESMDMTHKPGLAAADHLAGRMGEYIAPWEADVYLSIYKEITALIEKIDPSLTVIDTLFSISVDAVRENRRLHALVTPNILSDMLPAAQPGWTLFWKYPALGSGFSYPVSWTNLPANILINFRVIRSVLHMPKVEAKRKFLRENGLKNPIDFMGLYRPDVPWITQTLPDVHLPLVRMPANVTLTGPINLAGTEVKTEEAKELLKWMQKPTVLVNLGSGFMFNEGTASIMLAGLQSVLSESTTQIIWKMQMELGMPFDDGFLKAAEEQSAGRLRIVRWLDMEPPTLLQEANISAYVHHGGAGSFHDTIGAGVPHVILPLWADLYDFAQLSEHFQIGIWGCRATSPQWTPDCLKEAILKVVKDSEVGGPMSTNAKAIGERANQELGRDVAAKEVARLAGSGY